MFGNKPKPAPKSKSTKIDTLIGQNSELHGDVIFSGGLHVDGVIKGNVYAESDSGSILSVSERGLIEGEVRVPNIILNGSVNGDVHAADHIELAENAKVTGNVYYKLIEMVRGAEVNGNLVHRGDKTQDFLPGPNHDTSADKKGDEENS
ncbi:bactofilin family protein [Sedimenticola sp.]|uniref:bactofilin family protein n=1 Tax=Sedimenticola sp. TaxID=1940285 RepID=UPI003D0EB45B